MDNLKDLLQFVTSANENDPRIIEKILGDNKKLKLFQLAEAFKNPLMENDKNVMKLLYGNKRNSDSYRQLKSRLKDRLVDAIFLGNTEKFLKFPYDTSLFNVQRNLLAAQVLLLLDKRRAAINLIKPSLHSAIHFEHTQLATVASKMMSHHAALSGSKKELNYYSNLLSGQLKLFNEEIKIVQLYNNILVRIVKTAEYDSQTKQLLKKSYFNASTIYKHNHSHIIILHYYRIAIRYWHSLRKFKKVIQLCKDCNRYLEKNPHLYQRSRAGEFALLEMDSCLRLQHYTKGMECAERCMDKFTKYNSPWMVFNEFYFLLAMRTGNYIKALEIFYVVTSSYRFKKLSPIKIELWKIYEAWLNFVLPDSLPKKQFNLFRFLNEVHTARLDKTGYNFSILIAQILLLINIQEKEKLFELEVAFRQYVNRYIKKSKYPRHSYFGIMLRLLYNSDFDADVAAIKAKPWLKKLEASNHNLPTLEETEIIPYPILWNLILKKCSQIKW